MLSFIAASVWSVKLNIITKPY